MSKTCKGPFPGSKIAVSLGCLCPVVDNHHGRGVDGMGGQYWINDKCPVHDVRDGELIAEVSDGS